MSLNQVGDRKQAQISIHELHSNHNTIKHICRTQTWWMISSFITIGSHLQASLTHKHPFHLPHNLLWHAQHYERKTIAQFNKQTELCHYLVPPGGLLTVSPWWLLASGGAWQQSSTNENLNVGEWPCDLSDNRGGCWWTTTWTPPIRFRR